MIILTIIMVGSEVSLFLSATAASLQNAGKSWSYQSTIVGDDQILRFEVRPGDHWRAADGTKERSEISSSQKLAFGTTYTLSYGLMIEPGAKSTEDNVKIGQLHGTPDAGDSTNLGPVFALQLDGERMKIVTRSDPNAITPDRVDDHFVYTDPADIVRGHWYDFKIVFRLDPQGQGLLDVWRDGVELVHYSGALGYNDAVGPYWKEGIYRAAGDVTMAVDFKDTSLVVGDLTAAAPSVPSPVSTPPSAPAPVGPAPVPAPVVSAPVASAPVSSGPSTSTTTSPSGAASSAPGASAEQASNSSESSGHSQSGGSGPDTLLSGSADDMLSGNSGSDTIDGGAGADSLSGGDGNDSLIGGDGADTLDGGAGVDTLVGGAGDDLLLGGTGEDVLDGGDGADVLRGGEGTDLLRGGAGNDTIYADAAADTLIGGDGSDLLQGGAGADVFTYQHLSEKGDVIADFQVGVDKLNVQALLSELGAGASVSFTHTAQGLDVFVDHQGEHDLLVLLQGVTDTALTSASFESSTSASASTAAAQPGDASPIGSASATSPASNAAATPSQPTIVGPAASASLIGGAGGDWIVGGAGNDTLHASAGHDVLDGGAGSDTAMFAGFAHDYRVALANGEGLVSGGPEATTSSLRSVETLTFLDGSLTVDLDSDAARIVRLYDAFLGRAPDAEGLNGYLRYVAQGHTLQDMAANAAASPEFQSHTATLTDAQYVEYVYETALHRHADPAGLANYVTALEDGTYTRTSLILQAAESPEHVAMTAPFVQAGLWEPNQGVEALELLYDAAVQRQPDAAGLSGYGALIDQGATFKDLANQMASSSEFLARHAAETDAQYIDALYLSTVGRHADAYGLAAYSEELTHGSSRGDVLYQVAMSQEHQSHVLSHFDPLLVS